MYKLIKKEARKCWLNEKKTNKQNIFHIYISVNIKIHTHIPKVINPLFRHIFPHLSLPHREQLFSSIFLSMYMSVCIFIYSFIFRNKSRTAVMVLSAKYACAPICMTLTLFCVYVCVCVNDGNMCELLL